MTNKKRDPARNTPARIEAREKAAQAVTLRAQGLTWAEVARRAGYPSPDAARVAVSRALDRVEADNVADLRAEEDAHLLLLRRSAIDAALDGDAPSLSVLLRVSESRRKLHGADRPATHNVTFDRETQTLAEQLADALNEKFDREDQDPWEEQE